MRITKELLMKYVEVSVAKLIRQHRDLVCIYLTGSMLTDDCLLGGTTDIDLILVHNTQPPAEREIQPLTSEFHLDMAHLPQTVFLQPRSLRTDPWLGSHLCEGPLSLFQTRHWFEFTQASVCGGQFNQPQNTLQRARTLAESARQAWVGLQGQKPGPKALSAHLRAVENAANAIACLSGPPLTERRFILNFPRRAQAVERPELTTALISLFMDHPEALDSEKDGWISALDEALRSAGEYASCPPTLQPCRHAYYSKAVAALWEMNPASAAWLLLRSWTTALCSLPGATAIVEPWQAACSTLGLGSETWEDRLARLDTFLDSVEEILDEWGRRYGV